MRNLLRTIAGVAAGYAIMVVLITLVQETWFGGVELRESSLGVLLTAGLLTSSSGPHATGFRSRRQDAWRRPVPGGWGDA